jgi:hypothetical protein
MPNATLKIEMVLTTTDGLEKRIGGEFDFGQDDGAAIDQYWANLKGTAMGSEQEERASRGKALGKAKPKK